VFFALPVPFVERMERKMQGKYHYSKNSSGLPEAIQKFRAVELTTRGLFPLFSNLLDSCEIFHYQAKN